MNLQQLKPSKALNKAFLNGTRLLGSGLWSLDKRFMKNEK